MPSTVLVTGFFCYVAATSERYPLPLPGADPI